MRYRPSNDPKGAKNVKTGTEIAESTSEQAVGREIRTTLG